MKCPYCQSKKMSLLTGTAYCTECQSYFRVSGEELLPIFIENKEVYRKYQKVGEKRILCAVCQEKNEMEVEKSKAEEEQRLKIGGAVKQQMPPSRNSLCRECVERVNEKLSKDERKYYAPYRRYMMRKRILGASAILASAVLFRLEFLFAGIFVPLAFAVRELRGLKSLAGALGLCALCWQWPRAGYGLWGLVAYLVLVRRRISRARYLQFSIDTEGLQKEILRKLKSLRIGRERESAEAKDDGRSFLHAAYSQHVKKSEEVDGIAKGIANLKIKDGWYGRMDKLVEWLASA